MDTGSDGQLQTPGLDARQIQHFIDQLQQMLAGLEDVPDAHRLLVARAHPSP